VAEGEPVGGTLASLRPSRLEVARAVRVSRLALRGLLRSRLPQMAAALAYRTLFGLLPISIVGIVLVRVFVSDADLTRLIDQAVRFTGIAEVIEAEAAREGGIIAPQPSPQPGPAGPPLQPPGAADAPADAQPAPDAGNADGPESAGEGSAALDAWVAQNVARFSSIRFDAIGVVGALLLIYAAISMVVEVERAFNHVCRTPTGRGWGRRITQYWTLLTLGAIFLAATFLVSITFREWVRSLADGGDALGRLLVGAAGFAVTVLISTALLTLAYTILPNRRLRLRPVAAGALVAAVCWEAGKWGFTQYLSLATESAYSVLYGSLALVPLFMLWVYLTWLIVLFGLQVAYGVQMLEDGVDEPADAEGPPMLLGSPALLIEAAGVVAARFTGGSSATADELAGALGVPQPAAGRLLTALADGGIVRPVGQDGQAGQDATEVTLARPAERVALRDILRLADGLTPASGRGPVAADLARAADQALGDATLAQYLDKHPGSHPSQRTDKEGPSACPPADAQADARPPAKPPAAPPPTGGTGGP